MYLGPGVFRLFVSPYHFTVSIEGIKNDLPAVFEITAGEWYFLVKCMKCSAIFF